MKYHIPSLLQKHLSGFVARCLKIIIWKVFLVICDNVPQYLDIGLYFRGICLKKSHRQRINKRGHEGDSMTVSLPINAIFDYKIRREDGNIEIQRFTKRSFKLRRWEDGIQVKIKTIDKRVGFFVTLRALKIIRLSILCSYLGLPWIVTYSFDC